MSSLSKLVGWTKRWWYKVRLLYLLQNQYFINSVFWGLRLSSPEFGSLFNNCTTLSLPSLSLMLSKWPYVYSIHRRRTVGPVNVLDPMHYRTEQSTFKIKKTKWWVEKILLNIIKNTRGTLSRTYVFGMKTINGNRNEGQIWTNSKGYYHLKGTLKLPFTSYIIFFSVPLKKSL